MASLLTSQSKAFFISLISSTSFEFFLSFHLFASIAHVFLRVVYILIKVFHVMILIKIILNHLSDNSNVYVIFETSSSVCAVSWDYAFSCLLACLVVFLLKAKHSRWGKLAFMVRLVAWLNLARGWDAFNICWRCLKLHVSLFLSPCCPWVFRSPLPQKPASCGCSGSNPLCERGEMFLSLCVSVLFSECVCVLVL